MNYLLGNIASSTVPILTCDNKVLYHSTAYPLSFVNVPNHDYLALYDSDSNCAKNDPYEGMIQSVYVVKGKCFGGLYSDTVYPGCDNTGALVGATYDSSDGSCKGAGRPLRIPTSRNDRYAELVLG